MRSPPRTGSARPKRCASSWASTGTPSAGGSARWTSSGCGSGGPVGGRLWKSVIDELEWAEERTRDNKVLTLTMCVNYGGRAELADAMAAMGREIKAGRLDPEKISEKTIGRYLDEPDMPDVDLFIRSSGEHRTSNFLMWQSAYAELVFDDTLWPDFDRTNLW